MHNQPCAKCGKQPARIMLPKLDHDGDGPPFEGVCLKCAQESSMNIMEEMGITPDDLNGMIPNGMMSIEVFGGEPGDGDGPQGQTPPIDFRKIFGGLFSSNAEGGLVPIAPFQERNKSESGAAKKDKKKGKNAPPEKSRKFLSTYCVDLTEKARTGKIDRIIGRERELVRLTAVLCRRQKNNPCLIGEPGVGKTAVAEALAQRIVDKAVPFKLSDKEIHLVDMTALVAGTQFRGQFESRIKGLLDESKALGNIILVIDEVHSIVGAGDAEGAMNAANILKPALSRGEIQVIGATTLTEYRKHIEKDSALERRFQPIVLDEPSVEESIEILRGVKQYYEEFSRVRIPDEVLRRAVILSERYITDRFLPDKAIDLIDEASAHLAMTTAALNKFAELERCAATTRRRIEEVETALSEHEEEELPATYKALAELRSEEMNQQSQMDALRPECDTVELTIEDIAKVIEIWCGVPAASITEHEFEQIDRLGERICDRIVGQDEAVDAVVRAIKRGRAGISAKRKPVTFIFAGSTGVGKTELVRTLAADLFNSPEALIRLDMSEYMEKHAVSRMIGAPPGYVGYDDAGQLTEKVRRRPYSVILFDEIEKAHPDVLNIMLQIFDDGRITDSHGRTVNFENTVIVMTTNAGSNLSSNVAGFNQSEKNMAENRTMKALATFLRPEFINRVDEIITFRSLTPMDFTYIVKIMLDDLAATLEEQGIKCVYSEDAAKYIAEQSFDAKYGARNMRRYIQRHVEDKIAAILISDYHSRPEFLGIGMGGDGELEIKKA